MNTIIHIFNGEQNLETIRPGDASDQETVTHILGLPKGLFICRPEDMTWYLTAGPGGLDEIKLEGVPKKLRVLALLLEVS